MLWYHDSSTELWYLQLFISGHFNMIEAYVIWFPKQTRNLWYQSSTSYPILKHKIWAQASLSKFHDADICIYGYSVFVFYIEAWQGSTARWYIIPVHTAYCMFWYIPNTLFLYSWLPSGTLRYMISYIWYDIIMISYMIS